MKRMLALLLAVCLLLGLAACGAAPEEVLEQQPMPETVPDDSPKAPAPAQNDAENGSAEKMLSIHPAADNAEVFQALNAVQNNLYGGVRASGALMADDMVVAEAEEAPAPMAEPTETKSYNAAAGDYSETNVQVKGVDEGDIVKTDGKYIYVLRGQELLILSAAATDSAVLFRKTVGEDRYEDFENKDGKYIGSEGEYRNPVELYVLGDRLAVVYNENGWSDRCDEVTGNWSYANSQTTMAEIYNVGDPASPVLTATFAQDGYYRSSRLTDGRLYVLSDYWLYDADADVPETYIPRLYKDGTAWNMPADCIWLPERSESSRYTVVTGLDVASGEQTGALSLLGGGDTVYMTAERLYIAGSSSREEKSEPRTEAVYTVTDCSYVQETALTCVSLEKMTVTASASVPGSLLNQFSMDEYGGYLRLVTTESGYSYTVYEDTERGFVNYKYPDEQRRQTNGLYVLDDTLRVVGSITGLAEDERVYSVRFDGDIGYFVTFRQTDPLFTVDLSEPTVPKILSALKIPGFSEYLHMYGEGRLFGLGMSADEETGWTETMKLSMFDTSDPANVTEKHRLELKEYYSEALYNHKAILISPEKDIIAFPAGNGYDIYGYSEAEGFYLRGRVEGNSDMWWNGDARGLYIGDTGYVVLYDCMWVLDLNEMTALCSVGF